MSLPSDAPADTESTSEESVEERLTAIENRVQGLEYDIKQAGQVANDALDVAEDALDTAEDTETGLREDIQELRQELDAVADRTDLLQHVKQASSLSSEEKAAVCLQTLVEDAKRNDGRASMTAKEAKAALGGNVDRTLMYKVLPRAAELVDDEDVLEYVREPRDSAKNSRLVLDLTAGDLPGTVAGVDVTGGDGL